MVYDSKSMIFLDGGAFFLWLCEIYKHKLHIINIINIIRKIKKTVLPDLFLIEVLINYYSSIPIVTVGARCPTL